MFEHGNLAPALNGPAFFRPAQSRGSYSTKSEKNEAAVALFP
jgi:hypothetical protein